MHVYLLPRELYILPSQVTSSEPSWYPRGQLHTRLPPTIVQTLLHTFGSGHSDPLCSETIVPKINKIAWVNFHVRTITCSSVTVESEARHARAREGALCV